MKPVNPMKPITPIAVAVVASLGLVGLVVTFGGSILVGYLLMEHYVHALAQQAVIAQLRSAAQTCKAVQAMDLASKGAKFAIHAGASAYGHKLAAAIHGLYAHSECPAILAGHYHPKY